MLEFFNRLVASLLWIVLLAIFCLIALMPLQAVDTLQSALTQIEGQLLLWRNDSNTNFVIAQIAVAVSSVLLFGALILLELWPRRRRGVRIRTSEGGSAELDTSSIARRLAWHLDQLAEVITVLPEVKSRGSAVDVRLEIETAPSVDVPMKTDEVVEVARDIIEQDMGLRLGKLDVRIRHAPFEEEWVA
ncbi:MAG: hypothetical protein R2873_14840 [Caldilineaceae bacterium]